MSEDDSFFKNHGTLGRGVLGSAIPRKLLHLIHNIKMLHLIVN